MKTKSRILQKLATFGLILATSIFAGGGYLLATRGSVNSITLDDRGNQTSFVKVGELFNTSTQTFNEDNYKILLKYITGNANATLATATTLAETNNNQFSSSGYIGTDASVMRAKTLSAGTQGSTSYIAKTNGKDICVRLGGLDWQVMYLSKDKSGNTILTLWLDNNIQEAWTDRLSDEGEYYGYIDGGLYSMWAIYRSTGSSYSINFPSDMYGSSYINAVTLNNGGVYGTSDSTCTTVTKSTSSAFALFTMPQYGLTGYLVTPRNISWQEEQAAKDILGGTWRYPNEAYSNDLDDFNFTSEHAYQYLSKEYNDAWADSYLWLPSESETGYMTSKLGLWNTSNTQRANYDASTEDIGSIVGSSSKYVYSYSWLRTGASYSYSNELFYARLLEASGTGADYSNSTSVAYAVRPALHINLNQINANVIAKDISTGNGDISVSPSSSVYNGSVKTPTITVTYNGTTLVNGTDYTLSYTLNGSTVSEIKEAGIYTITATGKVNYKGSLSTTYVVEGGTIASTTISAPNDCVVFKRSDGLKIYLNDDSYRLILGTDYTADFSINYTALTGTALVTGIGNYGGVVRKTFILILLDPNYEVYIAVYAT